MSTLPPDAAHEREDDLLTRSQASEYLRRFNIRMKPATLARVWSVGGNGPPCQHIRGKPWYPRGELRRWAQGQRTGLRQTRAEDGDGAWFGPADGDAQPASPADARPRAGPLDRR